MGTLVFNTENLDLNSYYQLKQTGSTVTVTSMIATDVRVFEVTGIPEGASVRRGTLSGYVSKSTTGAKVCTVNGEDIRSSMPTGSGSEPSGFSLRVNVRSNREVTISFKYQCYGTSNNKQVGVLYPDTIHFTDMTLTIVYDEQETEPIDDPQLVLVPVKTVKLFSPTESVFRGNGLCVLSPTSCTVTEEAGGGYELTMEHPIDEYGKWALLKEDCIVEAGIPPMYIPEVTMPPWSVWRVKNADGTDVYTTLPSYTKAKTGLDAVLANPTGYTWNSGTGYGAGAYCTYPSTYPMVVYQSKYDGNAGHIPTGSGWSYYWVKVCTITQASGSPDDGKGKYNPGVIKDHLALDTLVYKLTDYNSDWMQIRTQPGLIGYIRKADAEERVGETAQVTEPARIRYTQLFRIYEVSAEDDTHTVTVRARHVSYDLQRNVLYDVQVEECEPATTIGLIQGSLVNEDDQEWQWADMTDTAPRKILCDMTEPLIKGSWSFQNPIQALLDPEEGLAGKTKAKVIRDNQDIYILENRPRRGISIAYGVNLRGVTWTRSIEDVITRIVPRAKDKDGNYIYLDELFYDSEHIGEYAVISTEILDSEYTEGQKIKHLDGTESQPLTRMEVMERMLSEAEDRFYVDHCDSVTVGLEVEFLLLGDTEEYAQYRNLQRLQIYDLITVDTGLTRLRTQAQVSGYEWDCLRGRYNSISIGKVYKQTRRGLPGYRLASGAITYSKLSPDLISYIKGAE